MMNLNLVGLVLALLFIVLILSKKDKQLRDYVPAFFIFFLDSFLIIKYLFQNELVQDKTGNIYFTNTSTQTIYRIDWQTDPATVFFDGNEILSYQAPDDIIILKYDL